MPIIFKEKSYNKLTLYFKLIFIIFLFFIIILGGVYFNLKNKNNKKIKYLSSLENENLKYQELLSNNTITSKNNYLKKINLLINLSNYAESIIYQQILYREQKIIITATAAEKKNIFALFEKIKKDKFIKSADLVNIVKKNNFHFQIKGNTF